MDVGDLLDGVMKGIEMEDLSGVGQGSMSTMMDGIEPELDQNFEFQSL